MKKLSLLSFLSLFLTLSSALKAPHFRSREPRTRKFSRSLSSVTDLDLDYQDLGGRALANDSADCFSEQILFLNQQALDLQNGVDQGWILATAMGILGLQTGFTMLEAGTVQSKNVKSVLMKNVCDMLFGTLVWYFLGFGLFQGDNPFGSGDPFLFAIQNEHHDLFPFFVQQFGFAVTSVTIVSGCILSRIKFEVYIIFSMFFTGFVYPICAHLAWVEDGALLKFGYLDFAGSGVVHMIGGVAGLVGAVMVGPRVGRFYGDQDVHPGKVRPLPPHSTVLIMLGGFLLYIGWFSFNAGSSLGLGPEQLELASRAMINTLLASAAGGCSVTIYSIIFLGQHDVPLIVNGMLTGLVAITGPCAYVDTWAGVFIGFSAGLIYIPCAYVVLEILHIDDPLDAFTVHGTGGFYGVLCTGVFAFDGGLIDGFKTDLMVAQIVGGFGMTAYSIICAYIIFKALDKCMGLQLSMEDQLLGLDVTYHNGYAYPEFDIHHVRDFTQARQARMMSSTHSNTGTANNNNNTFSNLTASQFPSRSFHNGSNNNNNNTTSINNNNIVTNSNSSNNMGYSSQLDMNNNLIVSSKQDKGENFDTSVHSAMSQNKNPNFMSNFEMYKGSVKPSPGLKPPVIDLEDDEV